jgi:hypothetical protein
VDPVIGCLDLGPEIRLALSKQSSSTESEKFHTYNYEKLLPNS